MRGAVVAIVYLSASISEAEYTPRPGRPARGVPRPGRPARGSTSGEPIMALLDLLGRRWALRVIWELRDGPFTFRDLQERCGGVSSSVLSQRLAELREAGIAGDGNVLTDEGRRLLEAYEPLAGWARRWARRAGGGP
jgi:DNA-binding HxlR family transcriptional regulator